jgi:hypothetical protein
MGAWGRSWELRSRGRQDSDRGSQLEADMAGWGCWGCSWGQEGQSRGEGEGLKEAVMVRLKASGRV